MKLNLKKNISQKSAVGSVPYGRFLTTKNIFYCYSVKYKEKKSRKKQIDK